MVSRVERTDVPRHGEGLVPRHGSNLAVLQSVDVSLPTFRFLESGWPTKAPIESPATLIFDFFNGIDPTRRSACKPLSVLPVAAVPQVPLVNQCATADSHEGGCSNEVIWKRLPDRMSAAGGRVALADIIASSTAGGRRLANGRRDCICWHCLPILFRRWRQGIRLLRPTKMKTG